MIPPLRENSVKISDSSPDSSNKPSVGHSVKTPVEIRMQFEHPTIEPFGVKLYSDEQHWTEIGFDTSKKEFYIDRTHSGSQISPDFPIRTTAPIATDRPYDLTLIVDRSSVEAYAQDGTIAMTDLIYPSSSSVTIQLFPKDAKTLNGAGHLWELKSIWER
ncbi:GH32 C-terminal domain-containing protein [Edaphobacter aggregans]|uniref:GH32 C-terminal domain-containing protein n=1 Tax=Edaphobacter aggregans TaxID=570835 RepID=UPI0021ADB2E3|nr:GH32 C-terminal domain-containing protein [Edaphobacter aggregans]